MKRSLLKETLMKSASEMKPKALGAQQPKPIKTVGEVASTAQHNCVTQQLARAAFNQWFLNLLGGAVLALALAAPVWAQAGQPWTRTTYTAADVAELKNRSVFFAHNSVGRNILYGYGADINNGNISNPNAGVAVLEPSIPLINLTPQNVVQRYARQKGIAEISTGDNGNVQAKLAAFETWMGQFAQRPQIALLKLCYAEFYTDGAATFARYEATMDRLIARYPDVTFVHMTAPLFAQWSHQQQTFNGLMRAKYGNKVFDLAALEANGGTDLRSDWNFGDNHLNRLGSNAVASSFIAFLAQVPLGTGGGNGPTRQYTGQWIKVDGNGNNDENAWGLTVLMNFPGDPRYIFVPWYTYDKSGKASWYIFEGNKWSANDIISLDVFRYTGPNWGATPYNNNRITSTKVGTATLKFTSATAATLQYNVEGASRTINIAPIDNVPLLSATYTGQWYKPDEDNWGLTVLRGFVSNPNYVFVPWYTYDASGNASWYIFQNNMVGNTVSADVYRYTGPNWGTMPYDNNKITENKVGTAKLTFTSTTAARFEYNVEGTSRSINLQKLE